MIRCPWCSSENHPHDSLLGRLGNLVWHRCRYCGGEFSRPVDHDDVCSLGCDCETGVR